jgi:hypothetical protein
VSILTAMRWDSGPLIADILELVRMSHMGHQRHSQNPGASGWPQEQTFKARRRAEKPARAVGCCFAVHLPTGTAAGHDSEAHRRSPPRRRCGHADRGLTGLLYGHSPS